MSELRTSSPSVARLTDLAVWREREAFEEKTRRALALLRKKDIKIRELGEAASRRRTNVHERSAAGGRESGDRESGGGRVGGCVRPCGKIVNVNNKGDVLGLEECVREQAEQIEALLEEVSERRSFVACGQ